MVAFPPSHEAMAGQAGRGEWIPDKQAVSQLHYSPAIFLAATAKL
jgi:hypothetical protein